MNAAATTESPCPARHSAGSCPGTPAPRTSAPGPSRRRTAEPRISNTVTGVAASDRHAECRRALSQDFRVLTFLSPPPWPGNSHRWPGSVLLGVRAVRDVLQQRECFSRDVQRYFGLAEVTGQFIVLRLQLLVLCPQPRQLRGLRVLLLLFFLPARLQGTGGLLPPPVLQVRMVKPLFPQQRAALGTALRQCVERRQDPRLIRGGERPPLRPSRLPAAGHLTIMPRDRGLVSECHRHSLSGPVSPCFITEISYVPVVSCKSDREGPGHADGQCPLPAGGEHVGQQR